MFSKPIIFVLFAMSAFLATGVHERYQKERETAEKHEQRAAELANLQAHAAQLEEEVKYIQSDRGIEAEIRDRFDYTKEGERAVIVRDAAHATNSAASLETPSEQPEKGGRFFSWLFFWRSWRD